MGKLSGSTTTKDYDEIMESYDPGRNRTSNILSKYERTKIIGLRMEQIARSGSALVEIDPTESFDPYKLALEELRQKKIPFMICRKLPNGEKEFWRLADMVCHV